VADADPGDAEADAEDQEDSRFPRSAQPGRTESAMSALPSARRMASPEPGGDSGEPRPSPSKRRPPGDPPVPPAEQAPARRAFGRGPACLAVSTLGTMRAVDSAAQMEAVLAAASPAAITTRNRTRLTEPAEAYLGEAMAKLAAPPRPAGGSPARSAGVGLIEGASSCGLLRRLGVEGGSTTWRLQLASTGPEHLDWALEGRARSCSTGRSAKGCGQLASAAWQHGLIEAAWQRASV